MAVPLNDFDRPAPGRQLGFPRWGSGSLSRSVLALGVWLLSCGALPAQTLPTAAQEYEIKAAFLYNFAKFVYWPEGALPAGTPIVIAVFGKDPFGPTLENLVSGKTIDGRPLVVRRTNRLRDLLPCHILFISSSEKERLPEILQAVGSASVLTVSEMEEFLQLGGTVKFVMEENRVRFRINVEPATRSRLQISSKLLNLAKDVKD